MYRVESLDILVSMVFFAAKYFLYAAAPVVAMVKLQKFYLYLYGEVLYYSNKRRGGGIGIRSRLKICRPYGHTGSSPVLGIDYK